MRLVLLVPVAQFHYDARAPLSVEESPVEVIEGVDFRELSYESPHGGRVPAYLDITAGRRSACRHRLRSLGVSSL